MSFLWEDKIRVVEPYTPGEQPQEKNVIKLNTNENPYGPSDEIKKIINNLSADDFRKYPDPTSESLVSELAAFHNVDKSRVFVGVGSDDVLAVSFLTFFNSDKPILFADITYSFYPVWADLFKVPYKVCKLDDDFRIKTEDYLTDNGGVIIANPNAPTGIYFDKSEIIKILEYNKSSIVIIDEAYIDFAEDGSSCIDLIDRYDNLLITRTFSKSRSLAGLRIGYAIGNEALIKYMNDVKYSFNSYTMNYAALTLGSAVIKDNDYFENVISKIKATRERFSQELQDRSFKVLPSSTNFVFASHEKYSAEEIFNAAKKKQIYFRFFKQNRIDNFLRITIGKDEEMDEVIRFLDSYIK